MPELEDVLRSVNVQVCPQPMPEQVQSPRRANWLVPAIISAVVAFMFSCIGSLLFTSDAAGEEGSVGRSGWRTL